MYHKKDIKVGSQHLATKFGFVPDCWDPVMPYGHGWFNIGLGNGFCLTAPSHYLNQFWLIINMTEVWYVLCVIHFTAISKAVLMNLIHR